MAPRGHWRSSTAKVSAAHADAVNGPAAGEKPIATIEIKVFETAPGQSAISVSVAPSGPYARFEEGVRSDRVRTANDLFQVVSRELKAGLLLLAS
jgi:hypothetical protein